MEEIGVKTIVIAVSIFITLIILTILILEFSHISEIYKNVGETNVSFEAKFDELDKFRDSNNTFTSLDVINYIKKYEEDKSVQVCVKSSCNDTNNISMLSDYETRYNEYYAILETTNEGYKIVFNIK